jgi:hypothetical protein
MVVILGADRSTGILSAFSVSHHYIVMPLTKEFPPKSTIRAEANSPRIEFNTIDVAAVAKSSFV